MAVANRPARLIVRAAVGPASLVLLFTTGIVLLGQTGRLDYDTAVGSLLMLPAATVIEILLVAGDHRVFLGKVKMMSRLHNYAARSHEASSVVGVSLTQQWISEEELFFVPDPKGEIRNLILYGFLHLFRGDRVPAHGCTQGDDPSSHDLA
jgi:hypothetical protein